MSLRPSGLSKSRIISHQQCPKRLWLQVNKKEEAEENQAAAQMMAAGTYAGEIAQQMFPDGVIVDPANIPKALDDTKRLLEERLPIFEAALQFDGVLVFVDILVPEDDGFHLIEVKSSTKVKEYHVADTAIQTWVALQSGIHITRSSVACIDNTFVYPGGGDYEGLFYLTDVTEDIVPLIGGVSGWVTEARTTLQGDEPKISIGEQCSKPFSCPFVSYCTPPCKEQPEHPVSDLPNARKLTAELLEQGYEDLLTVPADLLVSDIHKRIHQTVVSGKTYVSNEVADIVSAIKYPRYYLDFETIQHAVPIWADTKPYQQVPFQWSCHIESAPGELEHREFLAYGHDDPRYEFARSLVDILGMNGAIVAYNAGFEKRVLRDLADFLPEFSADLIRAKEMTIDLLPITRTHYYHSAMHGSWSIKYVLPTIAPELAYDEMDVADGVMAQQAFKELMGNALSDQEIEAKRQALLHYCQQDTYAMVKIVHYFQSKVD
jgi:hypothetical protein